MWNRHLLRAFSVILLSPLALGAGPVRPSDDGAAADKLAPWQWEAMKYRFVGPTRGGRVTAVTGIPGHPHTFFFGSTGGGVWKTDDGGETWANLTDGFLKVGSIGAIAVADSDPNVIYAGTGSACPRGNISIGDGVYKSTDGGTTWTHIGLPKAGLIAHIRVHPRDPDLVYAAVLGNIFGPNPERGVYRSKDGGKEWERVLFVSDQTGAVDLSMDSSNPRVLYAGMWRAERKPWTMIDGGEEGGLYKSVDGGDTWKKLEKGLPEGMVGRIGVAVSPADASRVYLIQEAKEGGGVFRSDDGGASFQRVNKKRELLQRAWYYSHIFADPKDSNTVWIANTRLYRSVDGGRNFQAVRTPHGDNHDLWIQPDDTDILINSNDGGANVSYNGGRSWSTQYNQPTAEFYRVTLDNRFPYRLYAAQQDNTTIGIPSRWEGGLDPIQEWLWVGGGESGHIGLDPDDPSVVFAGNYMGEITRLDLATNQGRDVIAYPAMGDGVAPRDMRYRFQWNAPIRVSPHDPNIVYHASQYVHRSKDGGLTWEVISPDLTTDKPEHQDLPGGPIQHDHTGVEVYTTIFALEESPQEPDVLWAGTDDGRVHITRDAGAHWREITPPDMPSEGTVNMIELSAHAPGRAFIAVYRYRRNDFHPYIFRTDDYGTSWTSLADGQNGIPADHFVRVVREDPDRRGLLYAGTEFGMYVSLNDGLSWHDFQLNLPRTPVTDLAIHEKDLAVSTQGRAFWMLDDLTPLHQWQDAMADEPAHLFTPRDAYRVRWSGVRGGAGPEAAPSGISVAYWLKEKPEAPLKLEILDGEGNVIRTFQGKGDEESGVEEEEDEGPRRGGGDTSLPGEPGLNRFSWDMRYPAPKVIRGSIMSLSRVNTGPTAPPGVYQVRLTMGEWTQTRPALLLRDPRPQVTDADLAAQFELEVAVRDKLTETHDAIRRIRSISSQAKDLASRAVKAGHSKSLSEAAGALAKKLTAIEDELIQTKNQSGQDPINFPPKLDNQLAFLYTRIEGQNARPTAGFYQRFEDLKALIQPHLDQLKKVIDQDVAAFTALLDKEGVPRIVFER